MTSDLELDRILRAFVAEGADLAPQRDVQAALAQVALTPQRRPRPWNRPAMPQSPSLRWILVAGALLVLAVGIAVTVGSTLLRTPVRPPSDVRPPAPSPAVVPTPVPLVSFAGEDWAVSLKIPAGWREIGEKISEYRHFAGDAPEGHLSVTNENPYGTTVCSPGCVDFAVPVTIPYDPVAQLAGLKDSVGRIAGGAAWTDLPPDAIPGLQGGARLDTTAVQQDGSEWRRVHVIGLKARNVVAIAWSQPAAVFDESLFEAMLNGIVLKEAPVYSDGDLIPFNGPGYTMPVPGMWFGEEQPVLDGTPLSGVRRLGDSRVTASIGGPDGTFGWCDAVCRRFTGVKTLDELEAAVRDLTEVGASTTMTLGGEPARSMTIELPVARRLVIAMHHDQPVAILLDAGEWDVAPGTFDEMIGSFAFVDPLIESPGPSFTTADGRVRLALPAAWKQSASDDGIFTLGGNRMTVRAGNGKGSITTCGSPAGPWDLCREITPTSLDDLTAAVQPAPIADHGVGPPTGLTDATTLGGEPAAIVRIQAYEYPAKGGQEVVYIVAMHDDRPYIVRIHTHENELGGIDGIVVGFTFVD